jgi:hypothetical protein
MFDLDAVRSVNEPQVSDLLTSNLWYLWNKVLRRLSVNTDRHQTI